MRGTLRRSVRSHKRSRTCLLRCGAAKKNRVSMTRAQMDRRGRIGLGISNPGFPGPGSPPTAETCTVLSGSARPQ